MAITHAPKRKTEEQQTVKTNAKTERAIKEVINRGGGTVSKEEEAAPAVKNVYVSLTTDELAIIAELREHRPRDARSTRKSPISQHVWLLEAVKEKIEREKKKYRLS